MFRLYRKILPGEFFVIFGDCSQGGADSNFAQFGSKTGRDVPLVFQMQGVAAEATPLLRDAANWIYDQTHVKPVICLERNNGGGSEMLNLIRYNEGKYRIYYMKDDEGRPIGDKPGWDTTSVTRPLMLGDWLKAYESKIIRIYDAETQAQHNTFVVSKTGKPEAAPNTHDDAVISAAGMWQLMQTQHALKKDHGQANNRAKNKRLKMHV